MALRFFKDFDESKWTFGKAKVGKTSTVVTLSTGNFQIQPPVLSTVEDLIFTEPDLKFTFFKLGDDIKSSSFKEWLSAFDTQMVDLLDINKEAIWGESAGTMSKEIIEDQYRNSVTSKGKIKIYLNRDKNTKAINLPIVDRSNNVLDITEIPCDTDTLSILRCRSIRVGVSDISPQWEMLSISIKEKKKDEPLSCIIYDDDSDSDDFEMISDD